jgi:NAD(P)-dependent dehydrogenase (short-subunit alcohol dehydrogenase family)
MKILQSKNAFISGSSRGIGLACANGLAEQGANVFLVATNEKLLEKASSEIKQNSDVEVGFHAIDLRSLEGCRQASNAFLERFGQIDILVNSAGATKGGVFPDQSDGEMIDGFALKFHGAVRLCRHMWPSLKQSNGIVINIVGGAARSPSRDFMVGGSVNAALANFSKALAAQGLVDDVNVNWILPGMTGTERMERLLEGKAKMQKKTKDEVRADSIRNEGIRRLGLPEDVAELVVFLCSPAARHIQGAGIPVDGGAGRGYY